MEYTYSQLFRYFRRFLRPYWGQFLVGSLLRVVGTTVWLYNAYAFAKVINFVTKYSAGDSLLPLYHIFIIWGIVILVRNISIFGAKYFCLFVGERAALDIEVNALKHLSRLDITWHEKENAGNKMKRIQRGARGISELVRMWIINIIDITVNFIGTLYIISLFDAVLAGFIVGYQIVYYLISTTFRQRALSVIHKTNIKEEESTGLFFEIITNIRSVKVLGMGPPLLEYAQAISDELAGWIKKRLFWQHGGIMARGVWEGVTRIGMFIFVIHGILEGRYELGFLVLFGGYFSTLTDSVNELSSVAQDVAIARADVGRLGKLFEEPVVIENEAGKVAFPKDWYDIHIRNLSFNYGDNAVLSGIDLEIKRGEKIGIVGLSGAGKSTLFKLLLKEYEDYGGEVLIGDISLKNVRKTDYTHHVAAVLQDTEVFNLSLRKNILLANSMASGNKELFQKAIDVAHVNDFLHKLPYGIDSIVGEKGVKLSGGEKQRLGIARAIFKDPDILFLDEATSHLDIESEQKIQDSLQKFFKNVTAIVIAHRLSTIREMDRIIVIEGGKIIESGSFDQLLNAQNGRFREFWEKQHTHK